MQAVFVIAPIIARHALGAKHDLRGVATLKPCSGLLQIFQADAFAGAAHSLLVLLETQGLMRTDELYSVAAGLLTAAVALGAICALADGAWVSSWPRA